MSRVIVFAVFALFSCLATNSMGQSTDFDVFEASITEIQNALEEGAVTSIELVQQYTARIEAFDQNGPVLNSVVGLNPLAMEQAVQLDQERAATGPRSMLHGIPILVKDNYNSLPMATSGGSVALANFVPNENSFQVQKLLEAGAIVLGKTNLHEFAYGITTVGSIFGQTRNPYDIRRVPGGSSGGTGAAIAASLAAVGLGSDTCGSIRIPSAFNNLVGLRPTKGLSSIHGVMPLSHTQDVAGPLARSAEDLAIVLDIVSGFDAKDAATELMVDNLIPDFHGSLDSAQIAELKIGKLDAYFENASAGARAPIEELLDWMEEQGAEIVSIEIAELDELISASGLITMEFRDDLNAYLEQFGSSEIGSLSEVLELGLYHQAVAGALGRSAAADVDSDAYQQRLAKRIELRDLVEARLQAEGLDALVYPTIGQLPVQIGDPQTGSNCSLSANSGLPAISFPAGFSANGMPVGMELLGGLLADAELLSIAHAVEQQRETRQAPAVTPSLSDSSAMEQQTVVLEYAEGDIQFSGQLIFDPLKNVLAYEIAQDGESTNTLRAITLAIETADGASRAEPIVHNVLAAGAVTSTGEYFMSAEFRQAFIDSRVYMRIFAESLPAEGQSWWPMQVTQ